MSAPWADAFASLLPSVTAESRQLRYRLDMAFNVKNDETDRLLRELTTLTGESLTDAITIALSERLRREQRLRTALDDSDDTSLIAAIRRLRSLPVLDDRSDDAILGYDDAGLPR